MGQIYPPQQPLSRIKSRFPTYFPAYSFGFLPSQLNLTRELAIHKPGHRLVAAPLRHRCKNTTKRPLEQFTWGYLKNVPPVQTIRPLPHPMKWIDHVGAFGVWSKAFFSSHARYMSAHNTIETAFSLFSLGNLGGTELICRQLLQSNPQQTDALYLLGLVAFKTGHLADACQLIGSAASLPPLNAHRINTLGVIQMAVGDIDSAIATFGRSVEIDRNVAAFHNNLAHALDCRGDKSSAEAHLREALTLQPDYPEACLNLANIVKATGNPAEAETLYRRALATKPDYPNAAYNLGIFLKDQGRLGEALETLALAVQLAPNMAVAHNNLGIVLRVLNRVDEAEACFRRALELDPQNMEATANLGNVQDALGRTGEALVCYEKALGFAPDLAELHLNHAYALLKTGNFLNGWREHEWRWKTGIFQNAWPSYSQPMWDGSALEGKRILLWYEQGLGDTLQFIRYAPMVADKGGKVIVLCQPPLKTLSQTCRGIDTVVADDGEPLPDFDVHCPLMSLPLLLGTELSTIPSRTPYLYPEATPTNTWKSRLDIHAPNLLKVALVWAGNPRKDMPEASLVDARRSVGLTHFLPLLQTPGAVFFSLQKGDAAEQLGEIPEALRPLDFSQEWNDFADTAAFVANLDLIITVDTSVAHLAGALGKETWVLSRADGCWRWLLDRDDSPWYPGLKLYRQTTPGKWDTVVEKIVIALREKIVSRPGKTLRF